MARFLLTLWSFESHVRPYLALAHALRAAGQEVGVYAGPYGRSVFVAHGFRCFPFVSVNEQRATELVEQIIAERKRPWRTARIWEQFLLGSVPAQIEDIQALLHQWPADVIVCDMAMWGPILVLQAKGATVAVLSHIGYCTLPGPHSPAPGISLPPQRNPIARVLVRAASILADAGSRRIRSAAGMLRANYGLPPLQGRVRELYGSMPLHLIPSAPEFDYGRESLPPSSHYIGPCVWPVLEPASPFHHDGSVVVHEDTLYPAEPVMLRAAVAGLSGIPTTVVAGSGRDVQALDIGALPLDMSLEPWRPLSDVRRNPAVVVTNGNSGVTIEALSRGIPVVVVPSIQEQSEIGWRVHTSGAGLRLPERHCNGRALRAAVQRILSHASYGQSAQRLARAFARCGGPGYAAQLLIDLAAGWRSRSANLGS